MSIAQEQALTDVLVEGGARFELLPHRHTETASAEARALGLELDEVAKTVVVRTPKGYARVVVPASGRVDLGKLRALLGTDGVEGVSHSLLHLSSLPGLTRQSIPSPSRFSEPVRNGCPDQVRA